MPNDNRIPEVSTRVPDKRDPELIATRGPTLVVLPLDILQLLFQLGYAIADLAAIEVEIGLACAGALLPPADPIALCLFIFAPEFARFFRSHLVWRPHDLRPS
jgi:hypothetical protein